MTEAPLQISAVTSAGLSSARTKLVARDPGDKTSVIVGLVEASPEAHAPQTAPAGSLERGRVSQFVTGFAAAKGVDYSVSLLIQQANHVTPAQLGGFLQDYNLVHSPAMAQSEGQRLVDAIQSSAGGSLLLGVRAGLGVFVVLDSVAPGWSFKKRALLSLVVVVVVAALAYFGIRDEPPKAVPQAQSTQR